MKVNEHLNVILVSSFMVLFVKRLSGMKLITY